MEYKIVIGSGERANIACEEVEKEVQDLIKKGYQPKGGVSITVTRYGWYTATQAMVKMR